MAGLSGFAFLLTFDELSLILSIMVVDVDNLDCFAPNKNENRSIFPVNSKTIDMHMSRFKKFHVQAGMKDIFLEKLLLLRKLPCKATRFEILLKFFAKRKNLHELGYFLKYAERASPLSTLSKNAFEYRFVCRMAEITFLASRVGGGTNKSVLATEIIWRYASACLFRPSY